MVSKTSKDDTVEVTVVVDDTTENGENVAEAPWISPEIEAIRRGESPDMGKHIVDDPNNVEE